MFILDRRIGCIAAGVFAALMSGIPCFTMLTISATAYRKRLRKLEAEPNEEE